MKQLSLFPTNVYKKNRFVRSPLFYVGDKYKLMPQIKNFFPKNIKTYYDVFCGGGSASLNIEAEKYIMNDIDPKIIELHQLLQSQSNNIEFFIKKMYGYIKKYGLSLSELGINSEIQKLKRQYNKTYFAIYNQKAYNKLRNDYNMNQSNTELLYLLLIYGFNHMIRFNSQGKFNLPVGNVDWNKNVSKALRNYSNWYNQNNVKLSKGLDFEEFIKSQNILPDDFLYFDPPYLITNSDYNKIWSIEDEYRMYSLLDELNRKHIYWGLSNMLINKEKTNSILLKWANNYNIFEIKSNYISRFDNSEKTNNKEIYVTNYKINIE